VRPPRLTSWHLRYWRLRIKWLTSIAIWRRVLLLIGTALSENLSARVYRRPPPAFHNITAKIIVWYHPTLLHFLIIAEIPCTASTSEQLSVNLQGGGHLVTCHKGTEGEYRCSCTLSLTSEPDGGGWSTPRSGRCTTGNIGTWAGDRVGLDGCGKSRHPRGSIPGPSKP
jgi:hypothetical protein